MNGIGTTVPNDAPTSPFRAGKLRRRAISGLSASALALLASMPGAAGALSGTASRISLLLADGTSISAHWFALAGDSPRPAVVALHGCGGLWQTSGRATGPGFDRRYPEYIERLHAAGFHVLLPDSFSARGTASICAQRNGARTITVERRRGDVAAAVAWLAAQPAVDARRIVVLGWSHGAKTALASINGARPDAARPVAAAVVFYPGCSALLRQDFVLAQPLLMLLGEADDWTPPARCEQFVARVRKKQPDADITLRTYKGAHHGFDGAGPVRLRPEVPNGVDPAGVHAGGNPAARAAALDELDRFLERMRQ